MNRIPLLFALLASCLQSCIPDQKTEKQYLQVSPSTLGRKGELVDLALDGVSVLNPSTTDTVVKFHLEAYYLLWDDGFTEPGKFIIDKIVKDGASTLPSPSGELYADESHHDATLIQSSSSKTEFDVEGFSESEVMYITKSSRRVEMKHFNTHWVVEEKDYKGALRRVFTSHPAAGSGYPKIELVLEL